MSDKWFEFRKKGLLSIIKPLAVYLDLMDVPAEELNKKEELMYAESAIKYRPMYVMAVSTKKRLIDKNIFMSNKQYSENCATYEEYFDSIEEMSSNAVKFYEELFSDLIIPDYKFDIDMDLINGMY